jgi:hypothetical protein
MCHHACLHVYCCPDDSQPRDATSCTLKAASTPMHSAVNAGGSMTACLILISYYYRLWLTCQWMCCWTQLTGPHAAATVQDSGPQQYAMGLGGCVCAWCCLSIGLHST